MKYYLLLFSLTATIAGCSQSIGVKEKITKQNAGLVKSFDPNDIESMVTYYFASRIRKDDKWREVLPDSSTWSDRMKYSIKTHDHWNFVEFKNLGFYQGQYIKVYFKIEMNGKTDDGEDEVELGKENGKWFISKVPI